MRSTQRAVRQRSRPLLNQSPCCRSPGLIRSSQPPAHQDMDCHASGCLHDHCVCLCRHRIGGSRKRPSERRSRYDRAGAPAHRRQGLCVGRDPPGRPVARIRTPRNEPRSSACSNSLTKCWPARPRQQVEPAKQPTTATTSRSLGQVSPRPSRSGPPARVSSRRQEPRSPAVSHERAGTGRPKIGRGRQPREFVAPSAEPSGFGPAR